MSLQRANHIFLLSLMCLFTNLLAFSCTQKTQQLQQPLIYHAQGEMAGEVSQTGVILQSRLTAADAPVDGDVPGSPGAACFELSTVQDFRHFLNQDDYDFSRKLLLLSIIQMKLPSSVCGKGAGCEGHSVI
ncbi:hypothetical protein ACFL30_00460 [Candidatus Latescibacterota bacterium]